MITLRQLEALHWIAQMGTFDRAAARLSTTQSAISKRIQELEAATGLRIFDRAQRNARLTEQGENLLALSREMLDLQDRMLSLRYERGVPARRLRIGVTELSALTWLPRLVTALSEKFPHVSVEPEINNTRELHTQLQEDMIDIIIVPETTYAPHLTSVRVAEVVNAWMARPGIVPPKKTIPLKDLAAYPILSMNNRSGSGQFYNKWMRLEGASFPNSISSHNLLALLGLTVAGVGLCLLPHDCFRTLLEEKKLVVVPTDPPLPPLPYVAIYRTDRPSSFNAAVAELAQELCDFTKQLQG